MAYIKTVTTLESIRADNPTTIYYSMSTCWWTHKQSDVETLLGSGLPCDPRGGVLMETDAETFLLAAEGQPGFYGRHGLDAFMAAHNDNCVASSRRAEQRPACMRTWEEYNSQLDAQSQA